VIFYATLHIAPSPSCEVNAFAALPPAYTHSLLLDSLISGDWSTFGDALSHLALPAITLGIVETSVERDTQIERFQPRQVYPRALARMILAGWTRL
jgi:hypothetical protein